MKWFILATVVSIVLLIVLRILGLDWVSAILWAAAIGILLQLCIEKYINDQ